MKRQLVVAFLVLGFAVPAISADTAEPVSVDRMCGKLVSIEEVPAKGTCEFLPARGQLCTSRARADFFHRRRAAIAAR